MTKITVDDQGDRHTAIAGPNDSILDALLRSGATVSYCCQQGLCGMCASVLVSGETEQIDANSGSAQTLGLPAGQLLICTARALTNCEIRPVHSLKSALGSASLSVQVCRVVDESIVHLRLAGAGIGAFRFRAGQHVRAELIGVPVRLPSHLFLASRPGVPYVDFYLPLDEQGRSLVTAVRNGDEVLLHEASGSASLDEGDAHPFVIVAENSGLASALGMVDMLAQHPHARVGAGFLLGSSNGVVERLALEHAGQAGIPLMVLPDRESLRDAIMNTQALHSSPASHVRGYVKATSETVRSSRTALLDAGVRPWNIHVDTVT